MMRARRWRPSAEALALWAILLAALWLRLDGVAFGLPALNDPDEPLFMMTALEMLQKHSFDPGWFGHPGTITLYSLALVIAAVGGIGIATGRFADADALAAAVYADPGIVFLPARVMIVLCGVLCVWLTFRLGKRLGGARIGLVAAAILAVNAVHIEYSQIIRTDIQASVFMLLGALAAVGIAEQGRRRDYLLGGICAGLACATKWPAAAILVTAICAWAYRAPGERHWSRLAMVVAAAVITLFAVSPYLLIDHATVVANLSGEARPLHPGATGGGFFANLGWYVAGPLLSSLGVGGLLLAAAGFVWGSGKRRLWVFVILPFCLLFFAMICFQSLRWERWVVPLLPFAALAAARALCGLADLLPRHRLRMAALPVALLILLTPMVWEARIEAAERRHDTRQIASAWLRDHAPRGSSVLIEHAAFDLLAAPFELRTAMGSAGCVDVRDLLSGQIRYSKVDRLRGGGAIVDVGHVDRAKLESCRADFAVVTNHLRYRADPVGYREELGRYDRLLAGGWVRQIVKPRRGERSGPEVHIVELAPAR
ncbi:MAG: hypothetical protein A2885_06925 [Sphingopyxis sp. RIFCSPHIGHO2_01_FULL_65_24]|nr:MAG: hypothetical protein A2885_06925 [Sphingopyxis sp. RIFCSPHIGHO2_01_FULL_65_24]